MSANHSLPAGTARAGATSMDTVTEVRGEGLLRREDNRLLRGEGRFVHHEFLPGMLHVAFVRCPYARARLENVDFDAARAMPGVVAAFGPESFGALPMPEVNRLLPDLQLGRTTLIAQDRAVSAGEVIAMVVAASRAQALLAAECVQPQWTPLPHVSDSAVHNDEVAASDLVYSTRHVWRAEEVAQASGLSGPASVTVAADHIQPRLAAVTMEPRAAMASWDARTSRLTATIATQTPARARKDIARALGLPLDSVRVIAPDVGGAFGAKASACPEDLLVAWLARTLQQPVHWTASRSEEFLSGAHGRGARLQGELQTDAAGHFLSLRAHMRFPLGSWLPYSAVVPGRNAARILPGPYHVAAIDVQARGARTDAAPVNIYRGAGRPEAALLMERLVDAAARQLQIDPVALRRRNLIGPQEMPYRTPSGETFDSGDYPALLDKACEVFGYEIMRAERTRRRALGELFGIGVALYVEPCGQGWESARVRLERDGKVNLATGSTAQGQGHETTFAELIATELGIAPAQITVLHGDTATSPEGIGALASRSMAIGGSAIVQATRELVRRRDAGEPLPLEADCVYTAPSEAWSAGCVIAAMSIDADTGTPKIERIGWADDAGRVLNPTLAHGQLLGGAVQGLGQAMMEAIRQDEHGQLLTGSLMDYALPRAQDVPEMRIASVPTFTQANLLGAKGVGEAGCIGVPAALLNAALDALAPRGVTTLDFPLSPARVWQALCDCERDRQQ